MGNLFEKIKIKKKSGKISEISRHKKIINSPSIFRCIQFLKVIIKNKHVQFLENSKQGKKTMKFYTMFRHRAFESSLQTELFLNSLIFFYHSALNTWYPRNCASVRKIVSLYIFLNWILDEKFQIFFVNFNLIFFSAFFGIL